MNAVLREYILKGVFVGLWAYLALVQPDWTAFSHVVGLGAGGLTLGLLAGAVQQILRGYRPQSNPMGFLLLVLLDSPFFIYLGLVGGVAIGTLLERPTPDAANPARDWLGYCVIAGALLGYGFHQLTQVKDALWRFVLGFIVGGSLVYLAITYLNELPAFSELAAQKQFAVYILLGLPFFYVLTFCGEADESEVEIAALCAGLGIGLYLLRLSTQLPEYADKLIFLVPLGLYFVYATQVLPYLRTFKHTLRGFGYLYLQRIPEALLSFGRAIDLERKLPLAKRGKLATQGLLELHRRIDVSKLDDRTAQLLNFDFCLAVVNGTLIGERSPTPEARTEAMAMLSLIKRQRPDLLPRVDYLRAIAQTHAKQFDGAAESLSRLLNPETPYTGNLREKVLFLAWELALRLHPELTKRLGAAELAKPGRRMDAIRAVERKLAESAEDPVAIELKRELYSGLTEAEFSAASAIGTPTEFNYDYVEQVGLSLAESPDVEQRERGMSYLRIAGRGLLQRGPSIFAKLADLASAMGRSEEARGYLEQVKRAGVAAGPKNLPTDQRDLYIATLKKLSDEAAARGDYEAAVGDLRLYIEAGKEDAETLRQLAEFHEKTGDILNALLITERGLLYAKKDANLLEKKGMYYRSVDVERVTAVRDKVKSWFDVAYCLKNAKLVSDQKEPDLDTLEWGLHLARLARAVQPTSQVAWLAEARLRLRSGEREEGIRLLEDLREQKRGSGEDEDAWFIGTRLLGDMYLDELARPDLAIECYKDYREFQRSGADTSFRLGQAYEAATDIPNAIRSYEIVTAYPQHPRYWDATEAIRRLKGN